MRAAALILAGCTCSSASPLEPVRDEVDSRWTPHEVSITPVATGLRYITDIQAIPGTDRLAVLGKTGTAWVVDPTTGETSQWFHLEVEGDSELGLLGIAFAPDFETSGRLYTHTNPTYNRTEINAWTASSLDAAPTHDHLVLALDQPYMNHNGGQIAFGPDGMLYIGLGDGGSADDPHGNGQNLGTWLSTLLRIDVSEAPYAVPPDNPFVGVEGARPEIWAYGLRNPWKFAFGPDGRLVVADVGQASWEEVDLVERGDNLGWNVREGGRCFAGPCGVGGYVDPVWVYGRDVGQSITGGVFAGRGELAGRYLVGDFVTGRIWALSLPADRTGSADVWSLGKWPIQPSSFGRGNDGTVYVAGYMTRTLYRIE